MAGDVQSVVRARRDYWDNKVDDESAETPLVKPHSKGINVASNEIEFNTIGTSENGHIPVLNVMNVLKNSVEQKMEAKKSLILIRDDSDAERNAVPKKWIKFLQDKSYNRLNLHVSKDDFLIYTFNEIRSKFDIIQRKIRWGDIGSILIFDDAQNKVPRSLSAVEINKKESLRLSDLLDGLNGLPMLISIISPWSSKSSTRQLYDLTENFLSTPGNTNVNFLFPLVESNPEDFYCFEMSVMFRAIVNQLRDYDSLTGVMQYSQNELFQRINSSVIENKKICAIASTSFVFFSSCDVSRSNQQQIFEIGETVLPTSRIPRIDRLIDEAHRTGRVKTSGSNLEETCMNMSSAAVKFLNVNAYIQQEYKAELFCLALSMLHSYQERTDAHNRLSSQQTQQLWKIYLEDDGLPFSLEMQQNQGNAVAPRHIIKAFGKALYDTQEPEYKIARDAFRILKPQECESELKDPFSAFIKDLSSIRSIKSSDSSYRKWHCNVVIPYYGIFLTKEGIEAMTEAFNIHAFESGYRSAQSGVGLWNHTRDHMFYDGDEPLSLPKNSFFKRIRKLCELTSLIDPDLPEPFTNPEHFRLDYPDPSGWVMAALGMLKEVNK